MGEENNIPKVFISYSWSSREHENWVLQLAERLISDGVEVILDKWDLREGQDNTSFMEQMVTDENVTKVLAICDGKYADKANGRNKKSSGVGIEAQIISREVYEKTTQTKFIPVIVEYDGSGKAYTPVFFKSRFYIDMSSEERYLENYEQLLRAIYDKPIHIKPKLGKPPTYILEPKIPASTTFHKLEMFKQAVLNDKKTANGLLKDYLIEFEKSFEDYRIHVEETLSNEFDEEVLQSINNFLHRRDEFIDLIKFLANYKPDEETFQEVFRFLESIAKFRLKPEGFSRWFEVQFDNYRFILYELFLYLISILIQYRKFELANIFLSQFYFGLSRSGHEKSLNSYSIFNNIPESLDVHRNNRLELRRVSLTADIIKERAYIPEISFQQIIETDLILFLRSQFFDVETDTYIDFYWFPVTLVYANGVSESFARASSKSFFTQLIKLINVKNKISLSEKINQLKESRDLSRLNRWGYTLAYYTNLEKLDTLP